MINAYNMRIYLTLFFVMNLSLLSIGQGEDSKANYLNEIRKQNYSVVLKPDIKMAEPLGYFGDNYQRIRVKFISVIKSESDPLEYLVYGKTMLKDNISEFQGTIKIQKCYLYSESDIPEYKQGQVVASYQFFEDERKVKTGAFSGTITSGFMIDPEGQLRYDNLMWGADGYRNNQYEGQWKSYTSGKIYICNWGNDRIPNSNELDYGAGEFGVGEEYWDRGWKTYEVAKGYGTAATDEEVQAARAIESRQWWE